MCPCIGMGVLDHSTIVFVCHFNLQAITYHLCFCNLYEAPKAKAKAKTKAKIKPMLPKEAIDSL